MSPQTIDAMLAAGVTAEVLAAAWKAEIAKQEEATRGRRDKDAERQRRHRESRDVTRTERDPAPNERDNLTPTREGKTEPKGSSKTVLIERREAIVSCIRRAFPPPMGVSEEQWKAFCDQRKKRLKDRSYSLICGKLQELADAGWPPGEMIDLATERGWETVFKPRTFGNERSSNPTGDAVSNVLRRIGADDRNRQNAGTGRT